MDEPKKFSFGFSKIAKKHSLLTPKPVENVQYIKCVEDNTVKLVHEQEVKVKAPPVIPMPTGSSVKDRILEAIRLREGNTTKIKNNDAQIGTANGQNDTNVKPLTLDEMAAKELLENAQTEQEEKKETLVISSSAETNANRTESTLDDYDDMPIGDFGLAMLRGMGWDPKKGIGLNEKVITPVAPQVRPKGMGLGADKSLVSQTTKGASDELTMKKGSMVKVISGPHNQLYGKIEGFEELPGRILVRMALSNAIVSLNEFMVQLVGPTEYGKNAKVMNLDKYNAALEPDHETKSTSDHNNKREQKYIDNASKVRKLDRSPRNTYPSDDFVHRKKKSVSRERKKDKYKRRSPSGSDSSTGKYKKRQYSPDRRKKSSKKWKYRSSSEDEREKRRKEKKVRSKERSKFAKHKKHKKYSESEDSASSSDSDKYYREKHKKGRN